MRRIGWALTVATLAALAAACGSSPPSLSPSAAPPASSASPAPSASIDVAQGSSAPSPVPSPSASPRPAATPRVAPVEVRGEELGPRPDLYRGATVMTVTGDLRLRSKPRVSEDSIRYKPLMGYGTDLEILDGPVSGSGFWWYRVRLLDGLTLDGGIDRGWVAAADHDGTPWIEEVDYGGLEGPDLEIPPELPVPIVHAGAPERESDGSPLTIYPLEVVNWSDYPPELFEPAPDLEPCGANTNSSRTWIYIFDADTDDRLYGFCAFTEPDDLQGLWFGVEDETAPPTAVYVSIVDRLMESWIDSEPVRLPQAPAGSPAPTPH